MSSTQSYSTKNVLFYVDGLAEYCSNSSALAMELLQYSAKPWIWKIESEIHSQRRYEAAHFS